jgi:hypothetical protein
MGQSDKATRRPSLQAARNSLVSAIVVTSVRSTRIDEAPKALSSRFPARLIESRRVRSRLARNRTAAPSDWECRVLEELVYPDFQLIGLHGVRA